MLANFLALDQTYGQLFPTLRSAMWILVALALWLLIWKFSRIPGNGGKYIWQLTFIPFAGIFTTLPVVDYYRGLGYMWAELLFIPGLVTLACLIIVLVRLSQPKFTRFGTAMDLAARTLAVALEAEAASKAAKVAADVAAEAALHAAKVVTDAEAVAAKVVESNVNGGSKS